MRKIRVTDTQSAREEALSDKITKLEGAPLEKAIIEAFIEIDPRYQLAASKVAG